MTGTIRDTIFVDEKSAFNRIAVVGAAVLNNCILYYIALQADMKLI